MSMSSVSQEQGEIVFKDDQEAKGDQGLLNLLTSDTVFYVGGPPDSFQAKVLCLAVLQGQLHVFYDFSGTLIDLPPDLFSARSSVRGCFRNVKINGLYVNLKTMKTSGVSFGCEDDLLVVREAYFSGQSYLELVLDKPNSLKDNFYASFSFRTDEKDGLMLYHRDQVNQRKPSRSRNRSARESCQTELSHPESRATHFSGSTHSYQRYDSVVGSLRSM
ncbi:hypothetical protein GOODEAATRI_000718 [Goodea atripinnis]|uniref:Laminin G domain-containing protein n=1 Tax=Goodea atripinnis TaxID=208336 RepID=A0ABV0MDY9_9TELE